MLTALLVVVCAVQLSAGENNTHSPLRQKWQQRAIRESLEPIRPGEPGKRPFWTQRSAYFIHVPVFPFESVEGAKVYRFTLRSEANGKSYVFEADAPWKPLTPVWKNLPVGFAHLRVEGLNQKGGVVGLCGERTIYRGAPFAGPYHTNPPHTYRESARIALRHIFDQYAKWRESDQHHPSRYPSKMLGALIEGMVRYARICKHGPRAKQALQMARNAAQCLLRISMPPGSPLEYLPPTYHLRADGSKPDGMGNTPHIMMCYPVTVADSYLALHEATKDARYLQAARRIAETYRKTQLPSGSWPLTAATATGRPTCKNLLVPTGVIDFLHRLEKDHGIVEFKPVREAAFRYLMERVVKTFNLEGQFEDGGGKAPYTNHSYSPASRIARLLLKHHRDDPKMVELALMLVRFAEDQFVVWEQGPTRHPFPERQKHFHKNATTPYAMEQYMCYRPVSTSAMGMAATFREVYEATGDRYYLAKARSLANTLVLLQSQSRGHYPTWWNKGGGAGTWPNCMIGCACLIDDLATACD